MMKVTVEMPLDLGDLGTSIDGLVAECEICNGEIYINKASALIQGHDIDVANILTKTMIDDIKDQVAASYNDARYEVRRGIRHVEAWA
jgi:hypothetical protein